MRSARPGMSLLTSPVKVRRRGSVLRVYDDGRVLVENVNIVKKHQRGNPQAGQPGGIISKEMPIDVSNVMIFNPQTEKGDRIGYRALADGKKVRFFKSNNEVVDA